MSIQLNYLRLTGLQEALTKYKIIKKRTALEAQLLPVIKRFFAAQAPAVARAYRNYVRGLAEAKSTEATLDELFDNAVASINKKQAALLQAAIERVLLAGAEQAITDIPLAGISFTLRNPRATAWAKNYAAQLVTQVDESTKAQIRAIVTEGVANGDSYTKIAQQIKAKYEEFSKPPLRPAASHIRTRAELVAITETANAYSAGSFFAVMKAQDDTGLQFEKQWLTVGDNRVSDGCRDNQGQGWISADSDHSSGHSYPPRFPGCRCTEQYRRKR